MIINVQIRLPIYFPKRKPARIHTQNTFGPHALNRSGLNTIKGFIIFFGF